jgi:hypothetical protein
MKLISLPDEVFMGVLMGVAVYPGSDLIENIFASRPQDFKEYGVYTCRFYVEGEWLEVHLDTKLPCRRDQITGHYLPVYSRSGRENEVWIPFIEKAYAKALGNYESILKAKVNEVLMQLTGGSVQQLTLKETETGDDLKEDFAILLGHIDNDTLVLAVPLDDSAYERDYTDHELVEEDEEDVADEGDHKGKGFVQNRLYSIVACKDKDNFGIHNSQYYALYSCMSSYIWDRVGSSP